MELVQVGWRLDREIVQEIQRLATQEERAISVVVRRLLRQALSSSSPPPPNGSPPRPYIVSNIPPLSLTSPTSPPRDKHHRLRSDDPRFEAFWKAYPRKTGKEAARKAWAFAMGVTTPERVEAAVRAYKWPEDPRFIPHPSTWLNQGRWDDEPTPEAPRPEDVIPL